MRQGSTTNTGEPKTTGVLQGPAAGKATAVPAPPAKRTDRWTETSQAQPRRFSIKEFCAWANVGRTHLYALIRSGKIRARKDGRRTYILYEDGEAWITSLPMIGDTASPAEPNGGTSP